jgi:hypothetical protein
LLLLAAPSATACPAEPPQQPKYKVSDCYESPLLTSVGGCVGRVFEFAHGEQVYVGEVIACL